MTTHTGHTPGPWKVEEYQVPLGAGHYQVVGNNTHEIAYVPLRSGDAHLIAAAPEMLEALITVQAVLGDLVRAGGANIDEIEAYSMVKQAITKAEGRGV